MLMGLAAEEFRQILDLGGAAHHLATPQLGERFEFAAGAPGQHDARDAGRQSRKPARDEFGGHQGRHADAKDFHARVEFRGVEPLERAPDAGLGQLAGNEQEMWSRHSRIRYRETTCCITQSGPLPTARQT